MGISSILFEVFWIRGTRDPNKIDSTLTLETQNFQHRFPHPSPATTGAGKRISLTPRARLIDKDCNRRASCLGSASFDAGRLAWIGVKFPGWGPGHGISMTGIPQESWKK